MTQEEYEFLEELHQTRTCAGRGCDSTEIEMRYDAYNIPTREYCDKCYENNYPYRKDKYYNYLDYGEHLDEY